MNKKLIIIYITVVVIVGASLGVFQYTNNHKKVTKQPTPTRTVEVTKEPEPSAITVLDSTNLAVPYAPQAPYGNWAVHEESCEEAALLMYHEYLNGTLHLNNRIPDATADPVYRAMKSWQVTHYGAENDLTMDSLGKFATDYYGLKPKVTNNATADDIKAAISSGSPVLVPVMTHSLQNNMYGQYTVYHVLIIKGYDAAGVFTNDAGVGNGPDHHYTWDILFTAIDAQTVKMAQGRSILVLTK